MIPKTETKMQPTKAEVMAQADERCALMTARRAHGATYRVIGEEFGISVSRVRQIIEVGQVRQLLKNQEPNRASLPLRVRLALSYLIEEPKDEGPEERDLQLPSRLAACTGRHFFRGPNIGKFATGEMEAWLRERGLGSGLVDQSQKMMVAASAMAEKKTVGHRS